MTERKWTKGPWVYDGTRIRRDDGGTIADMRYKNGDNDGPLIAAAPDLYDALETILKSGSWYGSALEIDTYAKGSKRGDELEKIGNAALAKARGEK